MLRIYFYSCCLYRLPLVVLDVNIMPLEDVMLYLVVCRGQKLGLNRHNAIMVVEFLCSALP